MGASRSQVARRILTVRQGSGGACLVSVDGDGIVRRWTRDAEVLFGYSAEVAECLHIEQLIPFLRDRGASLEGWCRRVDGSAFRGWVASLSTADAFDLRSDDVCQVLVVSDITSRYMREQAAQRVRERIDAVTTSVAHLAFFSIDPANDNLDLWGAVSDVIGLAGVAPPRRFSDFLELVQEEDRARLRHEVSRARTGATFELEVRMIAELGDRWLLLSGSLVDGAVPRIVGAGLNVTRQRTAEEALRAAEARMHAVLEATSDGVMTIDASGAIRSLNPAAVAMFRAGSVTLSGAPWATLLDLASDEWPASGTLQEAVGRRVDGTTFACECGFTDVKLGAQRVTLVMMRDLTHRRSVERQVLDATEQLQRQIGQDLHDGLGQLLTGTAFLAKGLQINLAHEHHPQAQRIIELINLAIARVRSLARGLSPIHVEARSLEAVLRSTVSEASELLGVRCELKLVDFIDNAPPAAIAQLCLIAREAITNAVRHGHAQNIVVRLSRYGVHSMLSVEDDGVGIPDIDKPLEGLGLRSMRYRAKMIDGKLDIVRTRSGTTVRCTWTDP
jgi:signal transduction histidine kinase